MNEQGYPPFYQRPMTMEEFLDLREGQIQIMQLNNPQELMEETRHRRGIERDTHKSMLKQQEWLNKQDAKTKMYEIQEGNGETRMEVMNGHGCIVEKSRLFSCQIFKVRCFIYDNIKKNFFQIVLLDGNNEVFSELYPMEFLQSVTKLQRTILARYDCTISVVHKNMAWKWGRGKLISLYEEAKEILLPYYAGWFKSGEVWHFWTKTEETELLASEVISRYQRDVFVDLTAEEIVDELAENVGIIAQKTDAEILLLLRLWACLDNLECDSPPVAGLTLIGMNAVEIAKKCLRTMYSDDDGIDIVNLDADRIGQIREKVKRIQNTPVIYLSCEPENKSTQNRLAEVTSWMQSGYIEGTKVHGLFVFCLQEFSPSYPLDRTIVIEVSKVRIFGNFNSFSKMQSLLISIVENGGSYWGNEFENQYRKLLEEERRKEEDSIVPALEAMILTILRMLNLNEQRAEILRKEFYDGLHEIKHQMSLKAGTLLEIFRQGVEKMVSAGSISVIGVQENTAKLNIERLYFDDECYYFSKSILHKIAETLGFSRKAVLYVKQELSDNNWLKQYRKTANRRSELEVDVMVSNNDKKIRISVLAVKREFWDKIGGISLFER